MENNETLLSLCTKDIKKFNRHKQEIGKYYGNFKVLGVADSKNTHHLRLVVLCVCGKMFQVLAQSVRNYKINSCGCSWKLSCNDEFFNIPNLLNSYWAGFIAADGCISHKNTRLGIRLAEKDRSHLEKFKEDLNFSGEVKNSVTKLVYKGVENKFKQVNLTIHSRKLINDLLVNFNITDKKSLTLEFPRNLADSCKDAFILGYIDGDGYVSLNSKKLKFQIVGTEAFLTSIKDRFVEITKENNFTISKRTNANIFNIQIYGNRVRKLFTHFSAIEVPKLTRKWEKFVL